MKHKVFVAVLVLAVTLGVVGVSVRTTHDATPHPVSKALESGDKLSRPLACYRVDETSVTDRFIDYRGANYKASVSDQGFSFGRVPELNSRTENREFNLGFGSPCLEQGSVRLACADGQFKRAGFGLAQIQYGIVTEEYLFENRRVEQLFRITEPLAEGPLRIRIPVQTDLTGQVVTHTPTDNAFTDMLFKKGGLEFCDAAGVAKVAYHSAVAIDAKGRQMALAPRHENGEIILDVPADFMARADYPVVIDPWLDFLGSGVNGGITDNASHSVTPSLALTPDGLPFICWADDSAAGAKADNTDIYLKWWNGFEFFPLGTSMNPGGISQTLGKSVNPSLSLGVGGSPIVAWEDDDSGAISILVKKWPLIGEPGALGWTELAGSGHGQGIYFQFSPAQHPSVTGVYSIIPGVLSVDANNNITSTPSTLFHSPIVAFDASSGTGGREIVVKYFYPGAPAQPPIPSANITGHTFVPEGWYSLDGSGGNVLAGFTTGMSQTPSGSVSQYPSLTVEPNTQEISVAWQDTSNGNYEIYFRRYQMSGTFFWQVAPDPAFPFTAFVIDPPGPWEEVNGSASNGGVSQTANVSQYPSLAADRIGGTTNYTVAWEETESVVAPDTGTTSQIYLARSVADVAFGGLDGSATTGGISQTLFRATSPSVDVKGNYIGVAWADDSNGRSSIYVRRMFLGGGGSGHWDQVGFQGSAFPALNGEAIAPIDGISKSANFAIQPSLKLDGFGSPVVAWADGSGATFDVRLKVFSPNGPGIQGTTGTPPLPTFTFKLRQTLTDPTLGAATDIPVGGFGAGTEVFLSSLVFTEDNLPAATSLRLELEVQPLGNPFSNSPNWWSLTVKPDFPGVVNGKIAVRKVSGLPNANFKWQARTSDDLGRVSPWVQFATAADGSSFRINAAAPPGSGGPPPNGPPNTGGTGTGSKFGVCGLLGPEGILLLAALRLLRRRRTA